MLDAFLDDGFLIPTFEQLAALQIEYEGRVLETHYSLRVWGILDKNTRGGLGGPWTGGKGCFLPFHSYRKPLLAEQNVAPLKSSCWFGLFLGGLELGGVR